MPTFVNLGMRIVSDVALQLPTRRRRTSRHSVEQYGDLEIRRVELDGVAHLGARPGLRMIHQLAHDRITERGQSGFYRCSNQDIVLSVTLSDRAFFAQVSSDGRLIEYGWHGDVRETDRLSPLSTILLVIAARLQRRLVFHASVIEHEGRRYALAGPGGVGKSSMTLAVLGLGASLTCDDAFSMLPPPSNDDTVPEFSGGSVLVRANRDSLDALRIPSGDWRDTNQLDSKFAVQVPSDSQADRFPLDRLVVLQRVPSGMRTTLRQLSPRDAVPNWIGMMHPPWLRSHDSRLLFETAVALSMKIPAWILAVPSGLSELDSAARCLLEESSRS